MSRVALITGASRGIGAFLAQRLLADGWAVAAVSRTCAEVESARELSFPMDVTDVESVRAGIRRIQRHFGGLDAVVNNAGIASMNAAALASTESVTRMFEVNTVGTFTVSREALRALRKSASPRIVNLSSIAVPLHLEGEAAYGASKAAVEHLTRVMAREFAEWGITVNAIGPSAIATDLTSGVPRSALDALQARLSSSEPATMDDVYWTVSFLLDERSQLVTGQVMVSRWAVSGITEFLNRLRGYGDREAIVEPSRSWTYTELLSACEEVRCAIDASDLQSGDALAVRAEHGGLGIAGLLGSWASGIVAVPVNPSVSVTTVDRLRDIAHVRGELDLDPIGVRIESGPDPDPPLPYRRLIAADVPGLVLFTSGSSGEPKGVVHDVDRLLTRFEDRRPAAKVAAFLLFDHIGGVNTVLHTLAHGGCVVTMPDRSPRVVAERIQTEGVQVLPTTPTYLNMLAIAQELPRLASLELITYGTEVMPASTLAAVRDALPHVRLLQTYGMSELGIVRSRSVDESTWVSIGGPELEWRVIDGTLRIRTTTAMAGYLNAPDPFDGDGWFDTGDEVEVDGDRIRFLGRRDDTINVGGQKVHPATVESVIAEVSGVLDVAVAAEPTPLTGHLVAATVYTGQSDPGLRSQIRARIRAACLASLEPWQVPARIRFTDSPMATDRFKRDRRN